MNIKSELQMGTRLYNLDLLRFFAALAVLLFHYTFRGYMGGQLSPIPFAELSMICKYGYLGVDLFFIISGFVILMTAENASLSAFIASRISRLYPAYWVAVTLTSLVIIWSGSQIFSVSIKQYLINMTMLNGFLKVENIDGVYWSLLVELKFYLMIALVLLFRKMGLIKEIIIGWLLLSVAATFLPLQSMISKALRTVFITDWSSYFIAGMVFYMIKEYKVSADKIILLIASLCLSIYYSLMRMGDVQTAYSTVFSKEVLISIILIFYITFFLLSTGRLDFLNVRSFVKLGVLTYPLYLTHQFIGYILFYQLQHYNKYAVLSLVIMLLLLISYLINRLVEKPMGPWLRSKIQNLASSYRRSIPL